MKKHISPHLIRAENSVDYRAAVWKRISLSTLATPCSYLWCAITFQLGVLLWWVACLPFFHCCHHFPIMACSCIIYYCLSHLWDSLSSEPKSHIIIINKYLSHLTMANATLPFPSQTLLPLVHVKSLIKLSFCTIELHSYLPKLQLWEHVQSFCRWPHTLACCVGVEETHGKNTFKCLLKMAPRTTQQNSLSPWWGVRVCWILCVLSKLFICCQWQMWFAFCVLEVPI